MAQQQAREVSVTIQADKPKVAEPDGDVGSVIGTPKAEPEVGGTIGTAMPQTAVGAIADFLKGMWEAQPIHPVDMVSGAAEAIRHPVRTTEAVLSKQGEPFTRAREAMDQGAYGNAAAHFLNYLIPFIGPQIDEAQMRQASGEDSTATFLGKSTGIGTQVALPGAVKNLPSAVRTRPLMKNPNPAVAEAVAFGQREGIPVSASVATGNPVVRGVEHLADRSLVRAIVPSPSHAAESEGLARVSGDLARRASPAAAVPETAGRGVIDALTAKITAADAEADRAYGAIRQIEQNPAHARTVPAGMQTTVEGGQVVQTPLTQSMGLPVDLRAAKASLKPIFERLTRQLPVTQQQASKGLRAIENILNGPDHAPLSQVDADLSAIKSLARDASAPELRTASQGLAAGAVGRLEQAIQDAIANVPEAQQALARGRASTRTKYAVDDVLSSIGGRDAEPVQAFNRMLFRDDAGIDRLRDIAQHAPGAMPRLGRAFLDDLFADATSEGGFGKRVSMASKWDSLGPETKKLLFPDAGYRADLDNFFLLAKRMADTPNPSGTGHVVSLGLQGTAMLVEPVSGAVTQVTALTLSKLLHSPRVVKALTRGLTVPLRNRAAAAAVWGDLSKASAPEGAMRLVPSHAQTERKDGGQ